VRTWPLDRRIGAITLVAFALVAVVGFAAVGNWPVDQYDAWNLWTRKARLLFLDPHLPLAVFKGGGFYGGGNAPGNIHPDYPLGLPMLETVHLRGLGRLDVRQVHEALWLLLVAFVWAAGFLASRVTRTAVWATVLCGTAVLVSGALLTGYADVPMALFLGTGVLALGLWIDGGATGDLAVAALLLAGAASFKNEGMLGAAAALIVALAVVLAARRRDMARQLVVAGLAFALVAVVPWRIWLAAHDLRGDLPLGKGLDPSFLADRLDRVWPSMGALHHQLARRGTVAIFVVVGIALALVRLRGRERSPVAAFYLGTGVVYYLALVWAYWISPLPLRFHLDTSVDRIYVGIALVAVAAIVQLGAPAAPRMRETQECRECAPSRSPS
jgi:hypothetical protein